MKKTPMIGNNEKEKTMDKQYSVPSVNSMDRFKNSFLSEIALNRAIKGHIKGQGDPINDLLKIHNSRRPGIFHCIGLRNQWRWEVG